jgi:hypothetical protein
MDYMFNSSLQELWQNQTNQYQKWLEDAPLSTFKMFTDMNKARQMYWLGIMSYIADFTDPYWIALQGFNRLEKEKLVKTFLHQSILDYTELYRFNVQIAEQGMNGSMKGFLDFHRVAAEKAVTAMINSALGKEDGNLKTYIEQLTSQVEAAVYRYPEAIRDVGAEFGFHFDDGGYIKVAETDRFILYQVLSRDPSIKPRKEGKPIIIVNPYVLGPNILAFLPAERKSYVHAFADQGIPTYMRILKDIQTTPAVQLMTGEDDASDTRTFCEHLKAVHGQPVTLNGFCQGGFICLLNILSGELDGLVDALITCVAPIDGTKSKSLVEYMQHLPPRFRDLNYALKTLPNGNRIVAGKVMSWVYKLKSMEKEAPFVSFYRDLSSLDNTDHETEIQINKTAAALNHWLIYDRLDLPEGITKLSFNSYTIPIKEDGTLPVQLFGRSLNFKRIKEKGIQWLLCYAEGDDLVDRNAALAPLDYIDIEITAFPKGHGAIATSWSAPTSACALHTRFGKGYRGPVRFQLDLEGR